MNTIHKFSLQLADRQYVSMPVGAQILSVQDQAGQLVLWAHVDEHASHEKRDFVIVGTGHECPEGLVYLATVQQGRCVWHVFEDVGA